MPTLLWWYFTLPHFWRYTTTTVTWHQVYSPKVSCFVGAKLLGFIVYRPSEWDVGSISSLFILCCLMNTWSADVSHFADCGANSGKDQEPSCKIVVWVTYPLVHLFWFENPICASLICSQPISMHDSCIAHLRSNWKPLSREILVWMESYKES